MLMSTKFRIYFWTLELVLLYYVLLIMEMLWFALWKKCCFLKLISPSVASLEDDGKELSD